MAVLTWMLIMQAVLCAAMSCVGMWYMLEVRVGRCYERSALHVHSDSH
jgi:hypothetical protein